MYTLALLGIAGALLIARPGFAFAEQATVVGSQLEGDWVARARSYQRERLLLSLTSLALTPLLMWLFLRLGWSAGLRDWLEGRGLTNAWLLVAAYSAIVLLLLTVVTLPLSYIGLALRRSYGLSQEATGAWLLRQAKTFLVGLVISLVLVEGLYFLLRATPRTWWLWGAAASFAFSLLLTYLWPIVITPLFYKQTPVEDQPLRARIVELAERAGVKVEGVYMINASSTGNEGNAYFTGIGGATRIVFYDTLLERYPQDEVAVVLAHELGHWRHQHVRQSLLLSALLTPLALLLAQLILRHLLPAYGIRSPADVAGLPLLALLATLGSTLILPAQTWLSRHWERQADQFALEATRDPQAFIRGFERLAQQNLSDPQPPQLVEAIFYSHPSVAHRIEAAERFAEGMN